ncbi:right-handed parallel beta-helix repeat-containing protein [Cytobacillus sp. NJ13]|nr:right-handed parallel beta-helix repeat-containing protein [Cytobacillus sp. NJ13]
MTVINVPAGGSINAAIAGANPGDTIRVEAGVFQENIVISAGLDQLRLLGAGVGQTIVDGTGSPGDGMVVNSSFVTIAGFTVRDYTASGILVNTSDNIIRNLEVQNNGQVGIEIVAVAERNLIFKIKSTENNNDGILVNGNNNYVVECKIIENEDDGIVLNGTNNLAIRNRANGNMADGIEVNGGHIVIDNVFKNNAADGIDLVTGGNLIFGNRVNRNTDNGIEMSGFNNNLVINNNVKNNSNDGIVSAGGDNNRIVGNKVKKNAFTGVELDFNSNENVVDQNLVKKNIGPGILLTSDADGNAVRENSLSGNTPDIQADTPADTNNTFDENDCQTSSPPGLCS